MTDFERFQEFGRIREIAKDVDPYSLTFENNNHLYVALSSGQIVLVDHMHGRRDSAVYGWLTVLLLIGLDKRQKSLS